MSSHLSVDPSSSCCASVSPVAMKGKHSISNNNTILNKLMAWIPASPISVAVVVHWFIVVLPILIVLGMIRYVGSEYAAASIVAAFITLYCNIFFPQNEHDDRASTSSPTHRLCRRNYDTKDKNKDKKKKVVAVIGAGPSGLVTCKELLEENHKVVCYEGSNSIGGTFSNNFLAIR